MFPKIHSARKLIYLDHAATTPLAPEVKKAMAPFWQEKFGNPSSLYQKGREAKLAVEESRKIIARCINARPSEIIFTAGGTESVNLAIFGQARTHADFKSNKHGSAPHLITSVIEHPCVLNGFKALAGEGYKTTIVPVDAEGFINIEKLKKAVRPETILISVMLANNEIGTIEPVGEIARWLSGINADRTQNGLTPILLHTDACQAAGFLDIDVNRLGVDLISVNGSKIYGPKQTGFLYLRSGIKIKPLIYGGGQEGDLRGGTENVPGIVGLAKALELAAGMREAENQRLIGLRDYLITGIQSKLPHVLLNGPDDRRLKVSPHRQPNAARLPNNINFSFKGLEGEALMLYLDAYGIAVSTASACSTGNAEPSHVLLAIGRTQAEAQSAIRFTLGNQTSKQEINYLLKVLPALVKELRKIKNRT